MNNIVHAFHTETETKCPKCFNKMHIVYWHNQSKSLMCLKCRFGFNYHTNKPSLGMVEI